jgi:hypothetical protein
MALTSKPPELGKRDFFADRHIIETPIGKLYTNYFYILTETCHIGKIKPNRNQYRLHL